MPVDVVSVNVVDRATTAFATEVYTLFPGPSIPAPKPKRFGSAGGRGLETQPKVGGPAVLTTLLITSV